MPGEIFDIIDPFPAPRGIFPAILITPAVDVFSVVGSSDWFDNWLEDGSQDSLNVPLPFIALLNDIPSENVAI